MFRRKKKTQSDDMYEEELDSQQPQSFDYDEDEDVIEEILDEFDKKKPQSEKLKDFYVKKEDLMEEIRKYNESKAASPEGQRHDLRRAAAS